MERVHTASLTCARACFKCLFVCVRTPKQMWSAKRPKRLTMECGYPRLTASGQARENCIKIARYAYFTTATPCNTLHHTAPHCNTLHHTATHCNTLHHTATHCNRTETRINTARCAFV